MHCPDGVNGSQYVELVAAVSVALSRNLDARDTFLIAEFMQSVSYQMFVLGAFKEAEAGRAIEAARKKKEMEREKERQKDKDKGQGSGKVKGK